jgi:hypothetical protein
METLAPFLDVRVIYDDGDHTDTSIRASKEEATRYYVGTSFSYWDPSSPTGESSRKAVKVEFAKTYRILDTSQNPPQECAFPHFEAFTPEEAQAYVTETYNTPHFLIEEVQKP